MAHIPEIQEVMTPTPETIDFEKPLGEAKRLMRDSAIRHLPVTRGGHVVGMLSQRDLSAVESMESELGETVHVSDLCELEIYVVAPEERLDSVLAEMANRVIGSVIVVDSGKAVGIYTTVDVCRGFADLLRSCNLKG